MSVINREDAIAKIKDIPYVQEHPNIGLLFKEWLKSLPDADDGWIPYTGHDQNIEYGRYLVQTKKAWYAEHMALKVSCFRFMSKGLWHSDRSRNRISRRRTNDYLPNMRSLDSQNR